MPNADNNLQMSNDDREDYRRIFRKQVFQLLKWGYDRLNAAIYQTAEEEDITGDLVKKLDEITQDRSYPHWVGNLYICEDPRVNVDGRKGKRRQKIDIEFVRVQHGPRPRFFFEAKRLSAGTHATIGKYLGSEGLGEFLAGNYGREDNEAGMLGYIQSHTPDYWAEKIKNKLLNESDAYQVGADGCWTKKKIIEELEHCYRKGPQGGVGPSQHIEMKSNTLKISPRYGPITPFWGVKWAF
ncbi:MAG: hypothetical protein L6406_19695 [Desulfobacterales bacterium]|nr:hypothetical protein [Desulfobacterales bacterium]